VARLARPACGGGSSWPLAGPALHQELGEVPVSLKLLLVAAWLPPLLPLASSSARAKRQPACRCAAATALPGVADRGAGATGDKLAVPFLQVRNVRAYRSEAHRSELRRLLLEPALVKLNYLPQPAGEARMYEGERPGHKLGHKSQRACSKAQAREQA
jgi:hypothetical protein